MRFCEGISLAVAFLVLHSCTKTQKADSPEAALSSYVTTALGAKSLADKKKMTELSTGEALAYMNAMSDEDFKKRFLDSKMEFVNMKTKDLRQENNGDVSLVYELSFKEGKPGTGMVQTNKKIAYLTKEGDAWKIKATKNLKSFVEIKEELTITPEITDPKNPATEK